MYQIPAVNDRWLPVISRAAMQFLLLPSKAEKMKEHLRKYMENRESELSHLTQEKGLQKLTTEEGKRNFLQKLLAYSLKIF